MSKESDKLSNQLQERLASLTVVIDTREPRGVLDLSPCKTVRRTLHTGDYTIKGYEELIALERKSGKDLVGTVGKGRGRFEAEIKRLIEFPVRFILAETTWREIQSKGSEIYNFAEKVGPSHVLGAVCGWMISGVPVIFTHDTRGTALAVQRIAVVAIRRIDKSFCNARYR